MSHARVAPILAVAVVACAPDRGPKWRPAGNTSPRDGGTLRFATKDRVSSLDPTIAYDEVSSLPVHAIYDTLVDYAPASLDLVPRLAERWEISGDGLAYHFWLRDATYSDGAPVVAADFAYAIERARKTQDSPFTAFVADVTRVVALAPRELEIDLSRPNAAFLYILTMSFTTPQRAGSTLGCGPYVLASWDRGERLVVRRNPRYFDPTRAHLDEIDLLENVPRDIQFLMFERGELDAAERMSAPDYLWLVGRADWQPYLHRRALMNAFGSRMDVTRPPFTDRRVRQALNYALDKDHTAKLLVGTAAPAHGVLPPGLAGRDDALAPYPHDPARARALLAAAGYPDGFDIDYIIMNDDEAEKLAVSLQTDLARVGVRVHISEVTFAVYETAIASPDGPAFSKATWLADFPDPSSFFDPLFHSGSSNANTHYANPELDALLDRARSERDATARAELYRRAEHIVYDDAPWIFDYHQVMTEVTQPYVAGYEPHPFWLRDFTSAWLDVGSDGRPVPR